MKVASSIFAFFGTALVLAIPFAVQGQNSRLSVGPSASVDHYWGAGSNNIEGQRFSKRTKYSIGVNAYYKLSERFVLKSGLLYSRKGSKQMYDPEKAGNSNFITYRETESKANHIDLPLLVGYKVAQAGKWSLVPAAGVIASIKVSESRNKTYLDGSTETITLHPSLFRIALGLTCEAGINYQASENMQVGVSPFWRAMAYGFDPGPHYYGASVDMRLCF